MLVLQLLDGGGHFAGPGLDVEGEAGQFSHGLLLRDRSILNRMQQP